MRYPLPDAVSTRIFGAFLNAKVPAKYHDELFDQIARILVRENRELRSEVYSMRRDFAEMAERVDDDETASQAFTGEETCKFLAKTIRDKVYHDSFAAKNKAEQVEDLIREIFDEE